MPLEISPQELRTRGGILDQILEEAFDGAVVLDERGYIIYNTPKANQIGGSTPEQVVGKYIYDLEPTNPNLSFSKVLATGQPELGILAIVNGHKCMSDIFPVFWKGKLTGVIGTLMFRNMNRLKQILAVLRESANNTNVDVYDAVARIGANYTFDDFIGQSPATVKLLSHCRRVASRRVSSILILGETGTGKEILASAFHTESLGHGFHPFVKINCTAIPNELLESELFGHEKGAFTGAVATKKGKFEIASGGSILLDEIGDMDLRLQSKLLRVLEEGEYERIGGTRVLPLNAQVIASTNHDLRGNCQAGKFRSDLYYRLSTAEIWIPPLRARWEDIPLLAEHLIAKGNIPVSLSAGAMETLMSYRWPGNVRELRNVIQWLSFLGAEREISAEDVAQVLEKPMEADPPERRSPPLPEDSEGEKDALLRTLKRHQFNLSLAARGLGISRGTLYNRIKKHGIVIQKTPA
jgi:transcriptional regulator with PAS, ATPase and Fis domain